MATKRGEGSKGGSVIGHTRSGKAIYGAKMPQYTLLSRNISDSENGGLVRATYKEKGYTPQDHLDAAHAHMREANGHREPGKPFPKVAHQHKLISLAHEHAASQLKEKYGNLHVVKSVKHGEGSRGGSIIGHTRSGKPVYSSGHSKYSGVQGDTAHNQLVNRFGDYSAQDHRDAAEEHRTDSVNLTGDAKVRAKQLSEAHAGAAKFLNIGDDVKYRFPRSSDVSKGGEGSKGGSVIGHTRSGKPIYTASHPKHRSMMHDASHHYAHSMYGKDTELVPNKSGLSVNGLAESMDSDHMYGEWTASDHKQAHDKLKSHATNTGSVDDHHMAAGHYELAHRKRERKTKKSDAPDFCKSLFDITDVMQTYLAQQREAIQSMLPQRTDILNPGGDGGVPTQVPQVQVTAAGSEQDSLPFRVDVLSPAPMSMLETLAMAKSIAQLPEAQRQSELVRSGVSVVAPRRVNLAKSSMSLTEFADAVGTTEDTVRRLANRCGDPDRFVAMIRDKMPDIQRAHSLSDDDATALYDAAVRTVKSLNSVQWSQWTSKSFAGQPVTDTGLAEAIRMNGIMHRNQCTSQGIAVMGGPVRVEPHRDLEHAEPISAPVERRPLLGGNLAIGIRSNEVGPYAFRP